MGLRATALLIVVTLCVAASPRARSAGAAEPLDKRVEAAIGRAAACLWARHAEDHWDEKVLGAQPREFGGRTALCVYALLTAGQSHQEPRVAKTLAWLRAAKCQSVYARSLRVLALAQLPRDVKSPVLAGDVRWLLKAAGPDAAFDYGPRTVGGGLWDNSNTQMAHMALWAASRRGHEVPARFWRRAELHWMHNQTGDGGWSYTTARRRAYGSMTAAGLASMFICFDAAGGEDYLRCAATKRPAGIERGLAWLAENFTVRENPGKGTQYFPYYLFALERAGLASGYRYFGKHDWYHAGAVELLRTQARDGGWGSTADTALALLFLARGRQPVLLSKLRYDGAWNCRPRDMANLTRWMGAMFEADVHWQVLDATSPFETWHDAPILYISGAKPPKFTGQQLAKLREFAYRGGLILSEAACNSPAFNMSMQQLYPKIFPGLQLRPIEPTHPVFSVHTSIKNAPTLLGVSNGVRLLAIHSARDLSKAWQFNAAQTQPGPFRLAANIYFYATDFGPLRGRGTPMALWPAPPARKPAKTIEVALLAHEGNSRPEPMAYARLAAVMAARHDTTLRVSAPIAITKLPAGRYPAALMTGTDAFALSEAERKALRNFLNAGGLLIADAAGGSDAFDKAAREHLLPLIDDVRPVVSGLADTSAILNLPGLAIAEVSYRRRSRQLYGGSRRQRVRLLSVGSRPVILYSRDDITASLVGYHGCGLRGYAPDSGLALMRNFLLYAASRPKPTKPVLGGAIDVKWRPPTP